MKIVLTEGQLKNLYEVKHRPFLTDVEYIVLMESDDKTPEENKDDQFDLGVSGETNEHRLYYFYIGEAFFDEFYDKTYLELFDQHKDNKDNCQNFVESVISSVLEKMKGAIADGSAKKILKRVIKNEQVVRFKESDIDRVLNAHFGNLICSEFLEDAR